MRKLGALLPACVVALIAAAPADAGVVGKHVGQNPGEVRDYWTPERMANAVPVHPERGGPPPQSRARGAKGGGGSGGGTTTTWTSSAVNLSTEPLARTNGKVFFTKGGTNYVCSGTAIDSASDVVAWTAGHCVNDGNGEFATNWMFVVGYRTATQQSFTASALFTTDSWAADGQEFGQDFGAARLNTSAGALSSAVGSGLRPYSFTGAPALNTRVAAYGYPAAGKFKGTTLWKCDSVYDLSDTNSDPHAMGIPCDMTGGSSGGGWVDPGGRLISVNSYGYPGLKYMFGPQHAASATQVLSAADGNGPSTVVGGS
jgi:Trypsin-like peptidase domain